MPILFSSLAFLATEAPKCEDAIEMAETAENIPAIAVNNKAFVILITISIGGEGLLVANFTTSRLI